MSKMEVNQNILKHIYEKGGKYDISACNDKRCIYISICDGKIYVTRKYRYKISKTYVYENFDEFIKKQWSWIEKRGLTYCTISNAIYSSRIFIKNVKLDEKIIKEIKKNAEKDNKIYIIAFAEDQRDIYIYRDNIIDVAKYQYREYDNIEKFIQNANLPQKICSVFRVE